jgi:hypothetical protein
MTTGKDFSATHLLAGEPVMIDPEDVMEESYNPVLRGSVGVYRVEEGYPPSVRITRDGRWLQQLPREPLKDVTDQVVPLRDE